MATVQTGLADAIDAVGDVAQLDASAKLLLKHRAILAKILKECTAEFKDYDLQYIADNCFDGEVKVSKVAVDQDTVDSDASIVGSNTEDSSKSEGVIHYDIVFNAMIPGTKKIVRTIINIEIQVDTNQSYAIATRGVYYCARLISRQKSTVFAHQNYQNIQKVYSIWICPDAKGETANSIAEYGITQQNVYGIVHEPVENYDKMKIIIINLNDEGKNSEKEIIGFLSTIFSMTDSAAEKKNDLANKYHIAMTREIEEGVDNMCNYGTAVKAEGRTEGIISTLVDLVKDGILTIAEAAKRANMTVEEFKEKSGVE